MLHGSKADRGAVARPVLVYGDPDCLCICRAAYKTSSDTGRAHFSRYALVSILQLTRGIEKTVAKLVERLSDTSTEVTDEGLADVAAVSAGNNRVVSLNYVLFAKSCADATEQA